MEYQTMQSPIDGAIEHAEEMVAEQKAAITQYKDQIRILQDKIDAANEVGVQYSRFISQLKKLEN